MKNILFPVAMIALMALSSCYVEVDGGHRHRHFGRRHVQRVEIRTGEINQTDSLQLPANPNAGK